MHLTFVVNEYDRDRVLTSKLCDLRVIFVPCGVLDRVIFTMICDVIVKLPIIFGFQDDFFKLLILIYDDIWELDRRGDACSDIEVFQFLSEA